MKFIVYQIYLIVFVIFCITKINATCKYIEVENSDEKKLNGKYIRASPCEQNGVEGAPLYMKYEDEDSKSHSHEENDVYLYYYIDFQNTLRDVWVFGQTACVVQNIYAYNEDGSSSPEYITGQWYIYNYGSKEADDIDITCEDQSSNGMVFLIAILCTTCVLLIAMFPALWMYYSKKTRSIRQRPHASSSRRAHVAPTRAPQPPPYSEEPSIFTIQPGIGAQNEAPPYTSDMTFMSQQHNKNIVFTPPPEYNNIQGKPPAYDELSIHNGNATLSSTSAQDATAPREMEMGEASSYSHHSSTPESSSACEIQCEGITAERSATVNRQNTANINRSRGTAPTGSCSPW